MGNCSLCPELNLSTVALLLKLLSFIIVLFRCTRQKDKKSQRAKSPKSPKSPKSLRNKKGPRTPTPALEPEAAKSEIMDDVEDDDFNFPASVKLLALLAK